MATEAAAATVTSATAPTFAVAIVAVMTRDVPVATVTIVVVMALSSQVATFLKLGKRSDVFRGNVEKNASIEDLLDAMNRCQHVAVKQHALLEHEMRDALAARVHHHKAQPSYFLTFFTVDGTADVKVGDTQGHDRDSPLG